MTNQAAQTMPEPVTASMCPSSDYAKGWNDCLAAMLAAAPAASGGEEVSRTLPIDIRGQWYEVPIPVHLHVVSLRERLNNPATFFHDDTALANWLDSLHATNDDGASTDEKWEPAQRAAAFLRGELPPQATQPPSAASVSERARELLATEYDNEGVHGLAESIRAGTFTTHLDQCAINAITNALASAPDGFALVPVEPTEAMKDAGDYSKWNYDDAADIYKAMLRASGYAEKVAKGTVVALEQALTQQRGEAAAHASGVPGRVTDALVSTVEAAMHACYMDHDDYRLTTTLLHDMAVAAVNAVGTTPQPSADAVRDVPDGMVLVPREPTEAMIDAWTVCNGGPADCYRAMLSAASGEKGVG